MNVLAMYGCHVYCTGELINQQQFGFILSRDNYVNIHVQSGSLELGFVAKSTKT